MTVPVEFQGDGVASLDFRVSYDPEVMRPTGVRLGPAAVAADKRVRANLMAPGEYVVLMMGMNRETLGLGEIAYIDMEVLSAPGNGETEIGLVRTTFATAEGDKVLSWGDRRKVRFPDSDVEEGERESSIDDDAPRPAPDRQDEAAGFPRRIARPDISVIADEGGDDFAERLLAAAQASDALRQRLNGPAPVPAEDEVPLAEPVHSAGGREAQGDPLAEPPRSEGDGAGEHEGRQVEPRQDSGDGIRDINDVALEERAGLSWMTGVSVATGVVMALAVLVLYTVHKRSRT